MLFLPLLLLCTTATRSAEEEPIPYRFQFEVLASNLPQPMTMQQAPDGRIFFHEIAGVVKVFDLHTRLVTEIGKFEVTTMQENGLIGMALDPEFAKNQWIYFLHSPPDYDGQILSRVTLRGDKLDFASEKELLRWPEQREQCCHHAGALRFGPDGCLYISTGDNTNPFNSSGGYSPIDHRPNRGPWDAQKSSANTNDLRGKILRIRPTPEGGYTIPQGNLFPEGTPQTRPEIYAMGFRNPWRFQIDPKTGYLYVGDVGPDAGKDRDDRGPRGFDTLNQVRGPGNYGWPYSRGNRVYKEFDFESEITGASFDPAKLRNRSPNNTGLVELPPVQPPLIHYPSAESEEFPILARGGRTACGGPTFHYDPKYEKTDGLPAYYDGMVIFYDWQRPFIYWLRLDADGKLAEILPFPESVRVAQGENDGSGRFQIKRPVDFFIGQDGALYILDYGETWGANVDAKLVRMSYKRGNLPPVVQSSVTPTSGAVPLEVSLSAGGTMDREGDAISYEWKIEDKTVATGLETKVTLKEAGDFQIVLHAKDDKGAVSTATTSLTVGNTAPQVRFLTPEPGDFFDPKKPIHYQIAISDQEDGDSVGREAEFSPRVLITSSWADGRGHFGAADPGLTLVRQSDCLYCHSVGQKLVGPSLMEIAERYRGQADAINASVVRVLNGSTNVWGPTPMLPHPQHSADEIHMMVKWIYSLGEEGKNSDVSQGVEGQISPPKLDHLGAGIISAVYTDLGKAPAGSLSGKASVSLRTRRILAGQADTVEGPSVRTDGRIGAIAHGHYIRFNSIPLGEVGAVEVSATSGGASGVIEIRSGAVDGPLLGQIDIPKTGGWASENYQTFKTTITKEAKREAAERADLYFVFTNPGKSGLMDVMWIEFQP